MLNLVSDKNNTYPEPVNFEDHYSIMLIAFQHGVSWSSLGTESRRESYANLLTEHNWAPHDYLIKESKSGGRKGTLRYQPEKIMTPQVHEVLFGESLFSGEIGNLSDMTKFITDRLNPNIGNVGLSESLMFSLSGSEWINNPLIANGLPCVTPKSYEFQINWVDLFLYNDGTGLLAFKVESLAVENGIDQLSLMNRTLREFNNENLTVQLKGGEVAPSSFWSDIVFNQWLGFDHEIPDNSLVSKLSGEQEPAAGLLQSSATAPKEAFDRFQRCCKTLVVARTPDLAEGENTMLWGRPLSDPPIYYADKHYQAVEQGEWDATLASSQKSAMAGYATVRDMVVFELATVSEEQASLGWKGGKGWQYSLEYIRKVVDNNFVEVWEYWSGMGLRDTFTFVSYDKSMPIMWQAESYYYPLYALAYHNRFRLDCLSQSIVDYDMADAQRGRKMRDDFQRFRNQYWFQDVTVDFQGVEVYEQMKNGMGLNDQYKTVSSEVADVSDHLQEKWDRGTRYLFTVLAILFAPLMEAWNTWFIPTVKEAPIEVLAQMAGGAVLLLLVVVVGWIKFRAPIMALVRRLSRRFHRIVGVVGNN